MFCFNSFGKMVINIVSEVLQYEELKANFLRKCGEFASFCVDLTLVTWHMWSYGLVLRLLTAVDTYQALTTKIWMRSCDKKA